MRKILLLVLVVFTCSFAFSQNVGIGTNNPHPSAKLEVYSNTSGFLLPRMTTAERNAITNPAVGLQIYNTTTDCLEIFGRGKWNAMYCIPVDSSTLVTDIDGHTYPTVRICNQTWMAKNLDVARYRNGDPIPQVTDPTEWANLTTGAWCWYNNDSSTYGSVYGRLYNWYAVNDPRGLAPEGWHVPSDGEWNQLVKCLDANADTTCDYCSQSSVVGGILKENGTMHWNNPNIGATNETGFTGLPGGSRDDGNFYNMNIVGHWWSATIKNDTSISVRYINHSSTNYDRANDIDKAFGSSVRCVKDTPITTLNDGLVAYYPFNGNANDESGNGNNGVVNGATLTTDRFGNSGKAYSFNGVNDQIEIATSNGNFDSYSFSISFWLRSNKSGGDPAIISRTNNPGSAYDNYVIFESNGKLALNGLCVWTSDYQSTPQNTILGNNWKHVVAVSTPFTAAIYVNGLLAKADTVSVPSYLIYRNFPIRFGRSKNQIWGDYSGELDDIHFYNRALTQQEITYLATH